MGFFENFPYTNFHDINLNWTLRTVKALEEKITSLIANLSQIEEDVKRNVEDVDNVKKDIARIETGAIDVYSMLANKKIVVYGDSISAETTSPAVLYQPSWVGRLREKAPATCTIINRSIPGLYMTGGAGIAATMAGDGELAAADIIVIFGGVNDFRHSVELATLDSVDIATFGGALNSIATVVASANTTARVFIVSPLKNYEPGSYPADHVEEQVLNLYRKMLHTFAEQYGYIYIDGYDAPVLRPVNENYKTAYQPDGLHPTNSYTELLCDYIMTKVLFNSPGTFNAQNSRINFSGYLAEGVSGGNCIIDYCDGRATMTLSGTITGNGSNVTVGTLPAFMLPLNSITAAASVQHGNSIELMRCQISSTSGAITVRTVDDSSHIFNATMAFTVKSSFKTNSFSY